MDREGSYEVKIRLTLHIVHAGPRYWMQGLAQAMMPAVAASERGAFLILQTAEELLWKTIFFFSFYSTLCRQYNTQGNFIVPIHQTLGKH